MSELDNKPYEVSFIASAPEELKVGDRVKLINIDDCDPMPEPYRSGAFEVEDIDNGIIYATSEYGEWSIKRPTCDLRKLPDTISFVDDSDNVKAFKSILNEMAETYKAKDADYGSAYDDGYRLFGHTQLLSRIYEKFSRVKHLLDGNKPNIAENICDTLTDMAVQAICLRMLLQKNDFENVV